MWIFLWTHVHVVKSWFCFHLWTIWNHVWWVLTVASSSHLCFLFESTSHMLLLLLLFTSHSVVFFCSDCVETFCSHAVTTASVFCLFRNRKSLQALKDTLLLSDRNDWMTRRARHHPPPPPCLHVPPLPPPPGWWWFRSPLSLPKFGMIWFKSWVWTNWACLGFYFGFLWNKQSQIRSVQSAAASWLCRGLMWPHPSNHDNWELGRTDAERRTGFRTPVSGSEHLSHLQNWILLD